jgi:hypothetical protein
MTSPSSAPADPTERPRRRLKSVKDMTMGKQTPGTVLLGTFDCRILSLYAGFPFNDVERVERKPAGGTREPSCVLQTYGTCPVF